MTVTARATFTGPVRCSSAGLPGSLTRRARWRNSRYRGQPANRPAPGAARPRRLEQARTAQY
jgi:hypothetical protein